MIKNFKNVAIISVFSCLLIFLIFFSLPACAADKIQTVGGILQVQDSLSDAKLMLRGRIIPKAEMDDIIEIKEKYRIGQNDVVLVYSNCAGTACGGTGSGKFLTIKPDGTYKVSKDFSLPDEGYLIKQVGNLVLIKYEDHLKYITITYDAGKIKVKESKSPDAYGKIKESVCLGAYDLYKDACYGNRNCSVDDFPMFQMRDYSYYSRDNRFQSNVFDALCKKACTGVRPIDYPQFSKSVCGR